MQAESVAIYLCPVCHAGLEPVPAGYVCQTGHTFDRAREGYVNLLPVQHKRSREPGDSPEMLAARRRFLERGHYRPLLNALIQTVQELSPVRLLDLGCGEGYYAGALRAALPDSEVYGLDISKTAVKMAARRYPDCAFAVAGSYSLPFVEGSFSHLLNVFAPLEAAEASRVLAGKGWLLRVSPGPAHLFGLKALLYDVPHPHPQATLELHGFQLQSQIPVRYVFTLQTPEELLELIQMTPYAWKLQARDPACFTQALPFTLELDVRLCWYQKI